MGAPVLSDNAASMRTWLMQSPRPAKVHVYSRDGKEFDLGIRANTAWAETAISIEALDPERLEAFTADDQLIRAVTVKDLLQKEAKATAQQAAVSAAMQASDPETQRMIVFAELLEKAYAKAYDSSQTTVQVAFTQLQEICGSLAQQATAATHSANELSIGIRNLLIQQAHEAVAEAGDKELSPMEQMAANFLSGSALAKADAVEQQPTSRAKPNGKH